MKIADQLSNEQKKQLSKINSPKKKKQRACHTCKQEGMIRFNTLTNGNTVRCCLNCGEVFEKPKEEKVNWKEIMGMNRDKYKRVNGSVRRK